MMSSFDTITASLLKRMPTFRSSNHSTMALSLPQIPLPEEVVALVVDDDEGREILDLDAPDRLHAEFGIFHHLDLLDAVLGKVRRRSADRAEIEAAMLLAGVAHRRGAVALGYHHHRTARGLELIDERIH